MRRIIYFAISFLVISCAKDSVETSDYFEYGITAATQRTKTTLNGLTLSWATSDAIGVYVDGIQTNAQFSFAGANAFRGTFKITGSETPSVDYYAYYPYSSSVSGSVVSQTLSNSQTASFDAKNDVMVSDVEDLPYNESSMPDINFTFGNHLHAIVKITLTNTKAKYQDEKVTKIVLQSASSTMTGAYTFDVSDGENCNPTFSGTKYDNVTVKYASTTVQPPLTVGDSIVLYAVVKAGTYSNLKLTVSTTNYSGSRIAKNNVTFNRNTVTALPAIDFGAMLSDVSASIDDLGSYEYTGSDFWE